MFKMKMKFDLIGIIASDLKKIIQFYNKIIGIDIEWDGKNHYVEYKHEGIRLSIYERNKIQELLEQNLSLKKIYEKTGEYTIT